MKKPKLKAAIEPAFQGDDIMIDLETMSTSVNGAIMAIGACRFNIDQIDESHGFYRTITLRSNLEEHRHVDPDTVAWWMNQSDKARAALFSESALRSAVPLGTALDELREWIGSHNANTRVWGNGADFDISMLKHAYGEQATPWNFYNVRCFRTMKSMAQAKNVPKPDNPIAHHALFDAINQAQHLQAIWKVMAMK